MRDPTILGEQTTAADRTAPLGTGRKTLLIASEDEWCISPSLKNAIHYEFPWLDIHGVDSISGTCAPFVQAVPLILIDLQLYDDFERLARELHQRYPRSSVAFLAKNERAAGTRPIMATALVRGVLPMSLALDIWLAALRVLLLGGEYYPSSALLSAARRAGDMPAVTTHGSRTPPGEDERSGSRLLTSRELQILEMVSRGQQNKLIAAALALSEHTVKIHIHNIIAKLGVHNRTEAAGFYLDRRNGFSPGAARPSASRDGLSA